MLEVEKKNSDRRHQVTRRSTWAVWSLFSPSQRNDIRPINQSDKTRSNRSAPFGDAGQIVVEYVLLLVVAVMIAALITRAMVGRTEGSEGFVIQGWQRLIEDIGTDKSDDTKTQGNGG